MMRRFVFLRDGILRTAALILALMLVLCGFSACARTDGESDAAIVCTIYPIYDFVLNVLGEHAEEYPVRLLSDRGNDPHNYQPSMQDIAEISDCEVFLYTGGVSDAWVKEIDRAEHTRDLAFLDVVTVYCEEISIERENEDGHEHSEVCSDTADEHFWLSPKNAGKAVEAITALLCEVYEADGDAVADFRANADAYLAQLSDLDRRYGEMIAGAGRDTVLVADRFPFLYLFRDYGISYYAAFPGCSAETEASFSTIELLAKRVNELALPCVLITETGSDALAETVISASEREDVEILTLHSCQSVTKEERDGGADYLSIMEQNLEVLQKALSASNE